MVPIHQAPNSVTFGRDEFQTWQILLFPLALLGEKQHHWVTAMFIERGGDGTVIAVTGAVPGDSQIEAMLDHVESSIDADPNVSQALATG